MDAAVRGFDECPRRAKKEDDDDCWPNVAQPSRRAHVVSLFLRFQKLQLLATPRTEVNLARKLGAKATAFGENADTNRGTLTPIKKYPAINLNSCSRRSLQSYQQNLCKTLWKIMLSRLKSLGTACGNSRLHTK